MSFIEALSLVHTSLFVNCFSDNATNALVSALGVFASINGCVLGCFAVCVDIDDLFNVSELSELSEFFSYQMEVGKRS
ncbi:hypothetical protein CXF65_07915 [Psychrobacter sp. Sarcosine-3u-12]|nr:hypothetical protein CXF65_07915 [Psychrobacter sp. Sarcosine-3u-12]